MPREPRDPDDRVSQALDRLHAAPLEGFIALRRELAGALRKAGDDAGSRAVAAAQKPTRTAWALDQVAHHHADVLRAMFAARDAAVAAQNSGDAEASRVATRDYRARVAEVLKAAQAVLVEAGAEATPAQVRRMGETLQAGSAAGTEARRLLEAGWLARDEEQEDPFAGMEVGGVAPSTHPARPAQGHARPQRDTDAEARRAEAEAAAAAKAKVEAKRRIAEAQERVSALDVEAREAREKAVRAEKAAAAAQAEAEAARGASDVVEAKLRRAREELRAMRA